MLFVNLISVSQFIKNGCKVNYDTNGYTIFNLSDILIQAIDVGGAYKFQTCNLRVNLSKLGH